MLSFFRKYEWYFFLIITIVTVISFSFFGTYNTLSPGSWREQVAFKAIDGEEITRFDVDDMATFLSTDSEDKALYGVWGFNFLNDGVIRKDFLQTGLAEELVAFYGKEIQDDLQKRLIKEKQFKPYVHPQARFLSTENAWNYFSPEMSGHFEQLRISQDATSPEAFKARINLFLAEKQFPAPMLRQALRYQERQYDWISPDQELERGDLSLFGYHTIEDWFGPYFTRLVSEFIINAAILAEQKGYSVPQSEVMLDLARNAELSYQQNRQNPNIGVANAQQYYNEQLRRLNMDQTRAIKVWRQVLLFRRYFQDAGNSALTDTLVYQKLNDFAKQQVALEVYRLPKTLQIGNYAALQNFEIYLNAISNRSKEDPLAIPATFLKPTEVAKNYPELVQKRYLLEISQVNKKNLQPKVSLKEMWNWEVEDQNWIQLKKKFPDLASKKDQTREERFAILDSLDKVTRSKIDSTAKMAIVDSHPEWLQKALEDSKPQIMVVGLSSQGGDAIFQEIGPGEKREELIRLLDEAKPDAVKEYTSDKQTYFKIRVLKRDPAPSILTYAEANANGLLEKIKNRLLEKHYIAIREQAPSQYQKEDKSWKSFDAARDQVADAYFDKVLKALEKQQKALSKEGNKDYTATLRFYSFLQKAKTQLEKDPVKASSLVREKEVSSNQEQLPEKAPLADQWLLDKTERKLERTARGDIISPADAFAVKEQAWSAIVTPPNGDLLFFQVKAKGSSSEKEIAVAEQTRAAHSILSADAQRVLMKHVLKELSDKNAISLNFLNPESQSTENLAPEQE